MSGETGFRLYGKAAKDCTPDQIIAEIEEQLRRAIPLGHAVLPDSAIHSPFTAPAINGPGTPGVRNEEPLLNRRRSTSMKGAFIHVRWMRAPGYPRKG
ncbi:hypothetical protein [Lentzea sp. NPDC004782]|uniref:hypothetical protein n=1 Tax=Lentzea sp. NPDC004782 TaxID=3154458 RepID=UPI00339E65AD